jgi:hypothetical protein
MKIFYGIDFDNLPSGFSEDAVREEIIAPLLKALGYSAFDEKNKIIRSAKLEHPFVKIGTQKRKVSIIPDYLIRVDGKNAFVLEAKAPGENIISGKHIEQTYSYAFHPDVQTERFVLCDGKEIVIFGTRDRDILLHINVSDVEDRWDDLYKLLSPLAFTHPHIFNYVQDYGLRCAKSGLPLDIIHRFMDAYIGDVAKLNEDSYSISVTVLADDEEYYASFDFDRSLFETFLSQVPEEKKMAVKWALTNQPFIYRTECEEDSFTVSFLAVLGTEICQSSNGMEEFLPFTITSFL